MQLLTAPPGHDQEPSASLRFGQGEPYPGGLHRRHVLV